MDFHAVLDQLLASPAALVATLAAAVMLAVLLLRPSGGKKKPAAAGGAAGSVKIGAQRELKEYSRAEVAKHNKEDDLWLIIKSKTDDRYKVYDVTPYIDAHPGGDAIFNHAGGDTTEGFNGIQHPVTVYDLVEEYLIGYLKD